MTVQAIPTRYAGCHFRSRLEARWAVFFDTVGIPWEYEPQGQVCSKRLYLGDGVGTFPYLPDFWLPEHRLWAEVKGDLSDADLWRLLNAAASLSSNDGGGCHDSGGHDLVVLGPIPRPDTPLAPTCLHMHKGDLEASAWQPFGGQADWCPCSGLPIAGDVGELLAPKREVLSLLLEGHMSDHSTKDAAARFVGYTAARSARFEHRTRPLGRSRP